jgi:hypothetical protein
MGEKKIAFIQFIELDLFWSAAKTRKRTKNTTMKSLKKKLKHKKSNSETTTPSNPVFGGYIPDEIHPLVIKGIEYLSSEENLESEGLFRLSGDITHINHLKEEFNKGKYEDIDKLNMNEIAKGNVNNVASLMKAYFREMAEPLLTFDHYDMFIAAHGKYGICHKVYMCINTINNNRCT